MIAFGEERPLKKPRFALFKPLAPTGAVAASRSSAVRDEEYLAKLTLQQVDTDTMFFSGTARMNTSEIAIGQNLRRALTRPMDKEEKLRNAVYTELKQVHGINFPMSSEHWNIENKLRSKTNFDHRYKENDLEHLLHEFYLKWNKNDEEGALIARILHGLNVTTTSLPDMTVLRGKYLYFGEFKNSQKYTSENAAKQCTLYLHALLYYFRVRRGLDVKACFGFCVCGPDCFHGKQHYSVGLVRLSAPNHLGESLVPSAFTRVYNISDVTGIQKLIGFLKIGKIIEMGESRAAVDRSRRIPALLSLPRTLWESTLLVANGTASMVFKGTGGEILGLLNQFSRNLPSWTAFYSMAKELLESKTAVTFYLKIRLKESTLRENPASAVVENQAIKNPLFKDLYPVDALGDANCALFLMNDCGAVLHESEKFMKLDFSAFCSHFSIFRKKVISGSGDFLHGDALPHNIVYNENTEKLFLIDLDEGTFGVNAHKRIVEHDDEHHYQYLCYPNFLRGWNNRRLYTNLQLTASFLLLAERFENTLDQKHETSMKELREAAGAVNSFLKSKNNDDPIAAYGSAVDQGVYMLLELFDRLLEPVESS